MTIEAEDESQGALAAPQAVNNDDDLKSLVQTLAERVALLERGTDIKPTSSHAETTDDGGEVLQPRLSSFDGFQSVLLLGDSFQPILKLYRTSN